MNIFALAIFIIMYVLMIVFPARRTWIALGAAMLFLLTGILSVTEALAAINWNVLMMMSGTMILVSFFIESRMPNRIADKILSLAKDVRMVIIFMSLFAGVISALIDNVATVLMIAPVGLAICKKLKISPVPMILSIAVSSNLQGAATLVGDTTSILLGDYAKMDFLSFFWMHGRPGIFFAVELGALATVPIMIFLFRKYREPVSQTSKTEVRDVVPSILLIMMIGTLIAASFIPDKPAVTNGLICLIYALIGMIANFLRNRDLENLKEALYEVDVHTLLLLLGLFIAVEAISQAGVISAFAEALSGTGAGRLFLLYSIIVWGSVLISAFVDNIPYVATMLPVITQIAAALSVEPYVLYFGLLTGATLGGNLTPIGASANITGIGILRRNGYEVSFREFARIGVPFTLAAVTAGYVFIWIVWGGFFVG